jgi:hypothetical protein
VSYTDQVNEKRQIQAQTTKEQQEQGAILYELKKMQAATLMGSGKSTVILTDQTDLGDKLKEMNDKVVSAIKAIETPVIPDAVKVTNQVDTTKELKEVLQAIKSLKLVVEAPIINLPEPKVTVNNQKLDLAPLQATIRQALERQAPVDQDGDGIPDRFDLSRYIAQDMKDGEETQYVGFVNPEGHWYIVENDVKGNKMRYVFGSSGYSKHFKQASSYKYMILDKAINAAS